MTLDCSASKRLEPDCSASYHLPRINLLNWTGEYALHHPWLGPCFQVSKVCLTKLPDLVRIQIYTYSSYDDYQDASTHEFIIHLDLVNHVEI